MKARQFGLHLVGGLAVFVACASNSAQQTAPSGTVPDAKADPGTVDEVACTVESDGGFYAVKEYPGRAQNDLARGVATMCEGSLSTPPPGFSCRTLPSIWIKDGSVAAYCGTSPGFRVRFIMPAP